MWIGNFFLLVLNLPLIGLWVRMIMIPYHFLYPLILVFCAIGVFSLNNSTFDIYLMAFFGILGYVFAKLDCAGAPMLLGFIRSADGRIPASCIDHLARRSHGLPHAPDQRQHVGAGGDCDGHRAEVGGKKRVEAFQED